MLEIPWRRAVARCGLRGSDGIQGVANFVAPAVGQLRFCVRRRLAAIFANPRCPARHDGEMLAALSLNIAKKKSRARARFVCFSGSRRRLSSRERR